MLSVNAYSKLALICCISALSAAMDQPKKTEAVTQVSCASSLDNEEESWLLLDEAASDLESDSDFASETDVNFSCKAYDNESLILAAMRGDSNSVKFFIDRAADVNACDSNKETPLIHAARNNHRKIVKLLLDNGALVKDYGKYPSTALHYAQKYGYVEIAKLLQLCIDEDVLTLDLDAEVDWLPIDQESLADEQDAVDSSLEKPAKKRKRIASSSDSDFDPDISSECDSDAFAGSEDNSDFDVAIDSDDTFGKFSAGSDADSDSTKPNRRSTRIAKVACIRKKSTGLKAGQQTQPERGTFVCHCGYTTQNRVHLEVHKNGKHAKEKSITCTMPGCPFRTSWPQSLTAHLRNMHK